MIMLRRQQPSAAVPGPCARTIECTQEWIDGELAREAATALEAHVAACPACALAMVTEVRFVRVLRARTHIEPAPAALRDRVRARLRALA